MDIISANNGIQFDLDSLVQTVDTSVAGTTTTTVTYKGKTYKQNIVVVGAVTTMGQFEVQA